jgi:DNA-binding MarR family transcriptional regulator
MSESAARLGDHVARVQQEWRRVRPELDVSPLGVVGRLHRTANALTRELVALYAQFGLSEGDFDVLASLRRAGPEAERSAGDLTRTTMITTGGMTKRLDRLEAQGLIERRVGTGDRRSRTVALTDSGRELIDRAFTAHVANERRLVSLLSDDDAAALERILVSWLGQLDPLPPAWDVPQQD